MIVQTPGNQYIKGMPFRSLDGLPAVVLIESEGTKKSVGFGVDFE